MTAQSDTDYASLAHLALKKAALVKTLNDALTKCLTELREQCVERHIERFRDDSDWESRCSGSNKMPTLVQLEIQARNASPDGKQRRVVVDVSWRAREVGGEVQFRTRAASPDRPPGLNWQEVVARAGNELAVAKLPLPGGKLATKASGLVYWESAADFMDPDDPTAVLAALDEHLDALRVAGQALTDLAAAAGP